VLTIPIVTMRAVMTTLAADSTTFKAAICHLYTNAVVVTPAITLAALTEATFGGYAASATIPWNGPGSDEVGNAYLFGPQLTFIASSTTTPNQIVGAYGTGSGADTGTLLWVEPFATPIPISNIGDYVSYSPQVSLPGPNSSPATGP
jgi:hypothetical protein